MKVAELDNSIENMDVVLWQYDNAINFVNLVKVWNRLGGKIVTEFWDYFDKSIASVDTASSFGLDVWGRLMGIPRPKVVLKDGQSPVEISDDLFRRLLKARFFISMRKPTVPNYEEFLHILFPAEDEAGKPRHRGKVHDNGTGDDVTKFVSMSFNGPTAANLYAEGASHAEEVALVEQHHDIVYIYPAGIRYAGDDGKNVRSDVIGFNGQSLRNFANGIEWAADDTQYPKGGIISGTTNGNYEKTEVDSSGGESNSSEEGGNDT